MLHLMFRMNSQIFFRYLLQNKETRQFKIKERFIEFLNCNEKTDDGIASELLSDLERYKIPIADCSS